MILAQIKTLKHSSSSAIFFQIEKHEISHLLFCPFLISFISFSFLLSQWHHFATAKSMKNESRRIPFFVIKKKQNEKQIGLVSRRYVDVCVCVQRQQLLISLKKLKRKAFFSCSSLTLFQDVHRDSLISLVFTNGGTSSLIFMLEKHFSFYN